MLSSLPYEKIKSYQNWFTEAFFNDITFKDWTSGNRTCNTSTKHRIFGINSDNSDHVPVQKLTNVVFTNVADDAVAYLFDPPQGWANIKDCGEFPCTAPHNAVIKMDGVTQNGSVTPASLPDKTTMQILPNNPDTSQYIINCTAVAAWNGFICENINIAQLMLESLDSDKEDRTISPIYIMGKDSSFNSTLNSFMDHCWDGHYTCQKRLSRFPSMVVTNKTYEIYYTGTPPAITRYVIQGAETAFDYLHLIIDFSQSRLYNVYANDVLISANDYDPTTLELVPIQRTACGENVYFKPTYIYEFYLTPNCTVRLEAQDFLEAMVRLQMSYDVFFNGGGRTTFLERITSVLGITQDKIRIVSVVEGSVIIDFYTTSALSTSALREKELSEFNDLLQAQYNGGTLDLGYPILDFTSHVVTSAGVIITGDSSSYTKKTIHAVVYILMAFAGIALVVGIVVGSVKAIKLSKAQNSITDMENVEYEKGVQDSECAEQKVKDELEKF
jgi:hypothetical protein